MDDHNQELPLAGVKVLELGHTVMGPTCGVILADMGAEVIKIERAPEGDDTRRLAGFGAGFFSYFNRNKSSLALDLKSEAGQEALTRLIKGADVLVENFGPGAMDRLGFGYDDCSRINPRLIYCSLKGFLPGPYEKRPALDEVVQMMGGLAYMTGPSGRPLRAGASVVDIMGGTFGAVGVLAALHNRAKTGRGEYVRSALYESTAFLVGQHMAVAAATGQAPPPMPERGRAWSVYDLFPTADGDQVFIGVTSDAHWRKLCGEFGWDDLAADERLSTNNQRVEERDWFLPEVQKRLSGLTKREIMSRAETAGVPFAAVARPVDLFDDPHLNQAGALAETIMPNGSAAKLPKLPLRFGSHGLELRSQPPAVGRGGRAALRAAGYTDPEIDALIARGAVAAEE
jgi:crotonobetainyl-CoA:carnitine CoA-transferase CaiB-like acyl-CoA transferase